MGYTLKGAVYHWGVFCWLAPKAGNICFALLPVEEDTAALHLFTFDSHCATHWAAPAQSTLQASFDIRQTVMALSNTHLITGDLYPIMWISQVHKRPECNPVLKRTAALSSGPQLFR